MIYALIGLLTSIVIAQAIYFKRAIDSLEEKDIEIERKAEVLLKEPPKAVPQTEGLRGMFSILYGNK
jgi:hypothetical protein